MLHGFHAAAVARSRVQRNSVPSTHMRCMITTDIQRGRRIEGVSLEPGITRRAIEKLVELAKCFVRFPCVHAAATTPAQRLGVLLRSLHPAVSAFPERVIGSACASSFSRLARRSLALRPAHSRRHQFVTRTPKASATSLPP